MGEITIEINNVTVWCCRSTVKSNSFLCDITRFQAFNFPSRIWEVSRTLKFSSKSQTIVGRVNQKRVWSFAKNGKNKVDEV